MRETKIQTYVRVLSVYLVLLAHIYLTVEMTNLTFSQFKFKY